MSGMSFRNNVFSMGDNGFSTANRYPRQVAVAADTVMTMVQGSSIKIATRVSGSSATLGYSWRFECGPLTFFGTDGNVAAPAAGFAVDRPLGI